MKVFWMSLCWLTPTVLTYVLSNSCAYAQITADNSLKTTVTQNNKSFTIDDGTVAKNNLFHSFSQFSVPSGSSVWFNNSPNIQNIFARVTGGSISNINGLIRANGTANLFLLNAAGIVFGSEAQLNIGGSFVASTANNVIFADGTKFSTIDTISPPLLTMSVPVGLQLGADAGAIRVQGTSASNSAVTPPSLSVKSGQTLALVGSQINIDGYKLSATDGRIELWAVQNALVGMNNQAGWQLTSPAATANWGTITLRQISSVDASGSNGGAINIRGRGLTVQDGSNISSSTASGEGKGITINTTDFVELLGNSAVNQPFFVGITTSVGNNSVFFFPSLPPTTGKAGNITIDTGRLRLANGAWLQSATYGNNSRTGDITIRAKDVDLVGYENSLGFLATSIASLVFYGQNNQAGDVTIDAERIRLLNGSRISSSILFGNGEAGKVSLRGTESLQIRGFNPINNISSAVLSSIEAGTTGKGGQIFIDTGNLVVSNGGAITSEVVGSQQNFFGFEIPGAKGTAGSIDIRARDIQVSDPVIDGYSQTITGITTSLGKGAVGAGGTIKLIANNLRVFNGGQITSSSAGKGHAGNINLDVKNIDVQGISPNPINGSYLPSAITASSKTNFAAGSVNITTNSLSVRDGGEITVSNSGTGDAGNLNVDGDRIFLDNGGNLRAEVNGGSRGNIRLVANDVLLLRQGSTIITDARGASTGGNIEINAGSIVGIPTENSDISANAVLGSGGNIQITTEGIFGLRFQNQLTPNSDITASSQFGVSGTVEVNTVGVDPNSGLVELPTNVTDPSQQIATSCSNDSGSSFVATGRGGIPQNPLQDIKSDRTWTDTRNLSAYRTIQPALAQNLQPSQALVQATSWHRNPQGKIEFFATQSPTQVQQPLTCAALPRVNYK